MVKTACYCLTVRWLVILSAETTLAASVATFSFSSSDVTGPLRVTAPFTVMILTLCA